MARTGAAAAVSGADGAGRPELASLGAADEGPGGRASSEQHDAARDGAGGCEGRPSPGHAGQEAGARPGQQDVGEGTAQADAARGTGTRRRSPAARADATKGRVIPAGRAVIVRMVPKNRASVGPSP